MKERVPYGEAVEIAEKIMDELAPGCARIEIAGSLRRRNSEVGDIELVAIPHWLPMCDLFGNEIERVSQLDVRLEKMRYHVSMRKNGPHYKQFGCLGMMIDLFIPTQETWGVVFTIRTGNADFAKWLVTDRQHGGAMPSYMRCKDGRLWDGDKVLDTPEEEDVFRAVGVDWIEPRVRRCGFWMGRVLVIKPTTLYI